MMPASALHQKLRQLIGHRFLYLSEHWILIDLLVDRDCVVLQKLDSDAQNLQPDQYGQALRRGAETLCLPISAGEDFSDELLILLQGKL